MTNFSLNNALLACKNLPNVTLVQNVIDFDYYKNHTNVFVESYNARLLDCNSGCLNVSYVANELGHAFDLSKAEFDSRIPSLLAIKPSSFNSHARFLEERILYRKTTTLETTLELSIKLSLEGSVGQTLVLYYKSKGNIVADGFVLGKDDMCSMELSSEGRVLDEAIEIVFPFDASVLYMDVLDKSIHMHNFSVSVIELHNNTLEPA